MILGKLKNIGRYAGLYANLDKAIRFLEENNPMVLRPAATRLTAMKFI